MPGFWTLGIVGQSDQSSARDLCLGMPSLRPLGNCISLGSGYEPKAPHGGVSKPWRMVDEST